MKGPRSSRPTTKQRTDDGRAHEDAWSNGSGRQITREASVANDRENTTRTSGVLWTGPGRLVDVASGLYAADGKRLHPRRRGYRFERPHPNVRRPCQRTEDGYGRSTTLHRANGSVTTRDAGVSLDPETKTWKKEVTIDHTPASGDSACARVPQAGIPSVCFSQG
jgi:hypothetical protein